MHAILYLSLNFQCRLRHPHIHNDQVSPHPIQSFCGQFGLLWLLDDGYDVTAHGRQLLLWNLALRTWVVVFFTLYFISASQFIICLHSIIPQHVCARFMQHWDHCLAVYQSGLWLWLHSIVTMLSSKVCLPNHWPVEVLFYVSWEFGLMHLCGHLHHSSAGIVMFQKEIWLHAVLIIFHATSRAVHTSWYTVSSSTPHHCCWSSTRTSTLCKLSQLTKRTCENKLKKWMLPHCDRLKLKQPQLNAVWLKLPSWQSHCGSWHGPHTWPSTSPESSNWERKNISKSHYKHSTLVNIDFNGIHLNLLESRHWTQSGDPSLPRLTLSTIQSSTVSAIQNTVQLSSIHSHA